jgi:hypothetical protein
MRPKAILVGAVLALAAAGALAVAARAAEKPVTELGWGITFENFFSRDPKKGERPLYVYARSQDGQWVGAAGSSRKRWNAAWHVADLSGVRIEKGRIAGRLYLMLVPDPWVPRDHKPAEIEIDLEAAIAGTALGGRYRVISCSSKDESLSGLATSGKVSGDVTPAEAPLTLPDAYTLRFVLQNAMVGGDPEDHQRRLSVAVGVQGGQVVGAQVGQISIQHVAFDTTDVPTEGNRVEASGRGVTAHLEFPYWTRGGEAATYVVDLTGGFVGGMMSGRYKLKATREDGKVFAVTSGFDGGRADGALVTKAVRDDRPWFTEAPGHKPLAAGEHPRLFFRRSDLAALRRRAETPAGRYLIERLKTLLGGGEALPASRNPADKAYSGNKFKAVPGSYTISTAAGFAFLWQLTGRKKYADLARESVELAWKGQRDMDDRYAWVAPGGELRAGPSIAWYAAAYDLAYDAWDEAFRTRFARAIQDYGDAKAGEWGKAEGVALKEMVLTPKQGPNSNHYGAVIGGTGLAVLAILGDPGTDHELVEKYNTVSQRNLVRNLTGGFGDGGWFYEGQGPGQISSDTAFVPYVQALRVALGRDYTRPRPNAAMVTMVRVWELIGPPAVYPHRASMPSSYGTSEFHAHRDGLSRGGQFGQGFGAVPDAFKPALLWTFNTIVEPDTDKYTYDTPSLYPHRPMLALINWPLGLKPANPAAVLPKVLRDSVYEYFVFRNRWQDREDTVVTALLNPINNGIRPRGVMVWGLGLRCEMAEPASGHPDEFAAGQDGSGTIVAGETALAVDFSGASGAETLVVLAGQGGPVKGADGPKARAAEVKVGGRPWTVLTLSPSGKHPDLKVEGNTLIAGNQKVMFDGKTCALAVFKPAT